MLMKEGDSKANRLSPVYCEGDSTLGCYLPFWYWEFGHLYKAIHTWKLLTYLNKYMYISHNI